MGKRLLKVIGCQGVYITMQNKKRISYSDVYDIVLIKYMFLLLISFGSIYKYEFILHFT